MMELAKKRDIPIVFSLHNFMYSGSQPFRLVDYVVVPSQFSRRYYWEKLGLACQRLPNVVDWRRAEAHDRDPRYVTFVSPAPEKGVYVFARIAEQLARRRPDIPILVVEGRGRAANLRETGIDVDALRSLRITANTADPREFYGITKLLLVPSLWNEAWPLVPAEAMINGIPVMGSNRGACPSQSATRASFSTFRLCYTPESRELPGAEEVEPWVETIVRLWDDPELYGRYSRAARTRAQQWRPERLAPLWKDFFANVFPQPGPPLAPRSGV